MIISGGSGTLDLSSSTDARPYRVGTLAYTRAALLTVFFWMLWGDLCVMFMEAIIPRLVPLQLESMGAGKAIIGLVTGSIPAAVELVINPVASTYSDRFRSRIGRRRPFILACTPVLAACLLLVGLAPGVINHLGLSASHGLTVTLIGLLLAIFQVFNVIVLATYYYLITDVVPQRVIGTFTAMYRVAGTLGGMAFNKLVFPHSAGHELAVYVGAAGLYFVVFMLMGWRVKEGHYPAPPPPRPNGQTAAAVAEWVRESFSIRFYQKVYFIGLFYYFAVNGPTLFYQFFALGNLGMSRDDFGDAMFWAGFWSLPIFFVMGPIADRFHPLRTGIAGMAMMGVSSLGSYAFIHDVPSFKRWTVIYTVTQTVWLGSQTSLLPRLLPRERYGQYCSANNTFCAIGKFGAPVLCGWLIGALGDFNRASYLWSAVFSGGGVVAVVIAYLHWKRLGGDLDYAPPQVDPAGFALEGRRIAAAPIADPPDLASAAASGVDATVLAEPSGVVDER